MKEATYELTMECLGATLSDWRELLFHYTQYISLFEPEIEREDYTIYLEPHLDEDVLKGIIRIRAESFRVEEQLLAELINENNSIR